jgi:hypothetical protein
MANNIVEQIQANLAYTPVKKVDPNSQDTKKPLDDHSVEKLGQAAIPAVLTALYKFTRTEDGCNMVISGTERADWLSLIYNGKESEAVEKVAHYSGVSDNQAESHMENIADEAIKLTKQNGGDPPTAEGVKTYMSMQRHNILVHLPAALNMGDILNDEALDDKTNKMEGPVSNLMHKIENTFSGGGNR